MVEIKSVTIEDEEYQYLLKEHFYQDTETAEVIDNICHFDGTCVYVAEDGERIVGFSIVQLSDYKVLELLFISVNFTDRHHKVGSALLDSLIQVYNPKAIVAKSTADNLGFFEKYGFFSTELGENINDEETYYLTYRNI